jgi:hypothetical protein
MSPNPLSTIAEDHLAKQSKDGPSMIANTVPALRDLEIVAWPVNDTPMRLVSAREGPVPEPAIAERNYKMIISLLTQKSRWQNG